jgi:signal peptidase II
LNIWGHSKEFSGLGFFGIQRTKPSSFVRAYWLVLVFSLLLDQASKWVVIQTMMLHQSIPLINGVFHLTYLRNTGAAFSLLAEYDTPWRFVLFVGIASVAFLALTVAAYRERERGLGFLLPLGLISGGAVGNLMDRLFRSGNVVDFIEVSYQSFHWPVFNLADSSVFVGVAWLLLMTLRDSQQK